MWRIRQTFRYFFIDWVEKSKKTRNIQAIDVHLKNIQRSDVKEKQTHCDCGVVAHHRRSKGIWSCRQRKRNEHLFEAWFYLVDLLA